MRYLVVEKNVPLRAEMRDIPIETFVENLDTVLRILPKESVGHQSDDGMQEISEGSTSAEISISSPSAANEDSSGVNRVEDVSLTQREMPCRVVF